MKSRTRLVLLIGLMLTATVGMAYDGPETEKSHDVVFDISDVSNIDVDVVETFVLTSADADYSAAYVNTESHYFGIAEFHSFNLDLYMDRKGDRWSYHYDCNLRYYPPGNSLFKETSYYRRD